MPWLAGAVCMVGAAPGCTTKGTITVWFDTPAIPFKEILYVPGVNVFTPVKVTVALLPGVNGLGVTEAVVPEGAPLTVKLMGVVNPPVATVATVLFALAPAPQLMFTAAGVVNVNPLGGNVIEKLASDISKNILPTD